MSVPVAKKSSLTNGKETKSHQNGVSGHAPDLHIVWKIEFVSVDEIAPSPFQLRLIFDDAEMEELAASVRQRGVQQLLIVRTLKPEASKPAVGEETSPVRTTEEYADNKPVFVF